MERRARGRVCDADGKWRTPFVPLPRVAAAMRARWDEQKHGAAAPLERLIFELSAVVGICDQMRELWKRYCADRVEAPPVSSGWGGQRRYLVRVVVRDLRTCGGGRCYYAISDAAGNHAAGWSFGGKWWVPYVRQQASTCALEPQGRARREGPGSQRLQRLQGLAGQGLAGQGLAGQGLAGQGRALVVEMCEGSMLLERVKDLCC